MGWLTKLFSIFKQSKVESPLEKHSLHLNDFEEWLDVQKHHLLEKSKINSEILQYTNNLKAKRWELECRVDVWQNLVPFSKREEINHFFVETRKFLDLITFSDDLELDSALKTHQEIERALDLLIQDIEDDSFVSNYSYLISAEKNNSSDEKAEKTDTSPEIVVNPLLKELLEIRTFNEKFGQKMAASGLKTLENLHKKRILIEQMHETLTKLKNKEKLMQQRLQTAQAIKEEKEAELAKFKEAPLYSEIGAVESQRFDLRRRREDLETEILSFFSNLKPVFKKYIEATTEKNNSNNSAIEINTLAAESSSVAIVNSYLEDPPIAFNLDENLNILLVLEYLQVSLQQNILKFETEKTNSYLELIKKARSGYLEELHHQHHSLHRELEGTSIPLKNRDFVMKLEEAKYRVEHFSKHFEEMEEKKAALEEELENYQEKYDQEIGLLQEMIRLGLGLEITIRNFI